VVPLSGAERQRIAALPFDEGAYRAELGIPEVFGEPSFRFLSHLNAYTVSFGFGLEDENIHSPDEFFRLRSFERGQRAYCRLLEGFGTPTS